MKIGWSATLLVTAGAMALAGTAGGRSAADGGLPPKVTAIPRSISVLTYNVKGLPWPVARGRSEALEQISATFRSLRARGDAPDIAVVQEAFTADARAMIRHSGYRYIALGPQTQMSQGRPAGVADRVFATAANWSAGETEGSFVGSGLAILSDHPIIKVRKMTFPAFDCAGYDCLAAKGALIVTVTTPEAPEGIDVLTTHLNSRGASGVSNVRSDHAWQRQLAHLATFIADAHDPDLPLIVAGDFNVGHSPERRLVFLASVSRWTRAVRPRDALREIAAAGGVLDADARWSMRRARDWQLHYDGSSIGLQTIRITAPFGRDRSGDMLSDHVGYVATYRLRALTTPARPTA